MEAYLCGTIDNELEVSRVADARNCTTKHIEDLIEEDFVIIVGDVHVPGIEWCAIPRATYEALYQPKDEKVEQDFFEVIRR